MEGFAGGGLIDCFRKNILGVSVLWRQLALSCVSGIILLHRSRGTLNIKEHYIYFHALE